MNIHQLGAELFHAASRPARQTDRQTDVTKLVVTFRKFANAPKNTRVTTGARAAYEASLTFSLIAMQYNVAGVLGIQQGR